MRQEIVDNVIAIVDRHRKPKPGGTTTPPWPSSGQPSVGSSPQNIMIDGHDAVRAVHEQLIPTLDRLGGGA